MLSEYACQYVQWSVAIGATTIAAVIDARRHRIPNVLTLPVFVAGVIWAAAVGGLAGTGDSIGGSMIAGLPFVLLWLIRGGGAGDAKMMLALGAWLGVRHSVTAVLCISIAGGMVALLYGVRQRRLGPAVTNVVGVIVATAMLMFTGRRSRAREMIPSIRSPHAFPYGLAISLGTLAAAGLSVL